MTLHMLGLDVSGTYSGSAGTATVTLLMDDESDTSPLTVDGNKVIIGDGQTGMMTFEKE